MTYGLAKNSRCITIDLFGAYPNPPLAPLVESSHGPEGPLSTLGCLGGLGPPWQILLSKNSFGFYPPWDILGLCWDTATVGICSQDASHCVHQLYILHYPQSNAPSPSFPIKIKWHQQGALYTPPQFLVYSHVIPHGILGTS